MAKKQNLGELVSVEKRATDGGTLQQRVEFRYDAFANRIEKRIDSDGDNIWNTKQRYAYDGWNPAKPPSPLVGEGGVRGLENFDVWAELDDTNALQTKYLHGDIVDQIFARYDTVQGAAWLLTDRMGSVRDVLNNGSVIKDTLVYDGFGNITSETDSTWGGRYKWTGREHDVEIDLQFNRARYYDGKTGRWISQDPLGFAAGDNNLYRYARNVPTLYRDPSGLQDFVPWIAPYEPQKEAPGPGLGAMIAQGSRSLWDSRATSEPAWSSNGHRLHGTTSFVLGCL